MTAVLRLLLPPPPPISNRQRPSQSGKLVTMGLAGSCWRSDGTNSLANQGRLHHPIQYIMVHFSFEASFVSLLRTIVAIQVASRG